MIKVAQEKKMVEEITPMGEDFAQWYTDIIKKAQLCEYSGVRGNDDIKETSIMLGDREVKIAVVHGLANAGKLLDSIKAGEARYDFVEVMACKRGCIVGGGQPLPVGPRTKKARAKGIYSVDRESQIRFATDNPVIGHVMEEVINGKEHKLLHRNLH